LRDGFRWGAQQVLIDPLDHLRGEITLLGKRRRAGQRYLRRKQQGRQRERHERYADILLHKRAFPILYTIFSSHWRAFGLRVPRYPRSRLLPYWSSTSLSSSSYFLRAFTWPAR